MLAVLEDRGLRCPDCGEYWDDWYDEKGILRERNPPKVMTQRVCGGCRAVELASNAEEAEDRKPGAKRFLVPASPTGRRPSAHLLE